MSDNFEDGIPAPHWTRVEQTHDDLFGAAEINGSFEYFSRGGWPLTGVEDDDVGFVALVTRQTLSIDNSFSFQVDFHIAPTDFSSDPELGPILQMGIYSAIVDYPEDIHREDYYAGISATVEGTDKHYWAGYEQGGALPPDEDYKKIAVREHDDGILHGSYDADTRLASFWFWTLEYQSDAQQFLVPAEVETMGILLVGAAAAEPAFSSGELYWDEFVFVPEPTTISMLALGGGLAGLMLLCRRRKV